MKQDVMLLTHDAIKTVIQRAKRAAVWGAGGGNSRGLSAISSQAVALGNI